MYKQLTPLIDFLIAFLKIRNSSFYASFFTKLALNDELNYSVLRLKQSTGTFKKLYWLYSSLKFFFFPTSIPLHSDLKFKNIYFVVSSSDKWVLRGLAVDLCAELNKPGNPINYSIAVIESLPDFNKYSHFIAMHQSIGIKLLKNKRIEDYQVSIYYTHTRSLSQDLIKFYNRCYRIFFQSPLDFNLLISNQLLANKSVLLPIGYSPEVFNFHDPSSTIVKKFDFVVSLPYQQRFENIHYYDRKNLQNLERILFHMSKSYKILILGSNWEKSYFVQSDNISCINVNYKDKPKYYRLANTFLCLSRLEGGPIPLLEAIATGCNVITTNTGFASMVKASIPNIYLLSSLPTSPTATAELITCIYEEKLRLRPFINPEPTLNKLLLESHSFSALAQIIHNQFC